MLCCIAYYIVFIALYLFLWCAIVLYSVLLCFTGKYGKSGKQITATIGDRGGDYGPWLYRHPGGRWPMMLG